MPGSAASRGAPAPLAAILIAAGAAALVLVPATFGPVSLPSLALIALAAAALLALVVVRVPQALVLAIPALLPSPLVAYTYAWELLLVLLAGLVLVDGLRRRPPIVIQLTTLEIWLLVYTAWCLVSVFWSPDPRTYLIGARRVILGFTVCWLALRLPRVASRRWFDAGLAAALISLGLAAIARQATSGLSGGDAMMRRPEVTNLGWGTANFIATLLLLMIPTALAIAFAGRGPLRWAGWAAAGIGGFVQMMIASRAAVLLFVAGALVQALTPRDRGGRRSMAIALLVLAALLLSPLSEGVIGRLAGLRDLGSAVIRVWYMREGWSRMVDHWPFGMGLGQGYSNPDRLQGIDPHNFWLVVGGDHGLPGLVLWAGFLVVVWIAAGRLRATPEWRERGFALRIAMALGHLHTLVEPTFQGTQYPFVFLWFVCGTIAYHDAEAASSSR